MMKKAREFDNILDECLERILTRGETVEQCLASYPEHSAELEPLLRTSLDTKNALAIKPRPEFRERARYQFRAALQEMEQKRERRSFFFGLQRQWATAVIAVLVLLMASSGTVAAASDSMPDEPLYPVKLATETVRLALTPSALGKAELYARLADKRVAEIVNMADKGKPGQVEQAAERLNTHLVAMASLAAAPIKQAPEKETPDKEAPEKEAPVMLAPTPEPAPRRAQGPPEGKGPQEKDSGVLVAPTPKAAQRAPSSPEQAMEDRGAGDGGVKVGKRAELRVSLARRAVEHPEVLQAALERAPESVKPALHRAIAAANRGYEKALESLD